MEEIREETEYIQDELGVLEEPMYKPSLSILNCSKTSFYNSQNTQSNLKQTKQTTKTTKPQSKNRRNCIYHSPNEVKTILMAIKQDFIKEKTLMNNISSELPLTRVVRRFNLDDLPKKIQKTFLTDLLTGTEYALKKLKAPSAQFIKCKNIILEERINNHKKFLLLDLDETLVSSSQKSIKKKDYFCFDLNLRPHAYKFLEEMSMHYELYVFTAGTKDYAKSIIDKLNKKKQYIKGMLTREHCFGTKAGRFIKDLRMVKNRQLKDIILIDNLVTSFGFQIHNGIPIVQYTGQTEDNQLLKLIPFLKEISLADDVRPLIKEKYHLEELVNFRLQEIENFFNKQNA